MSHFELPVFALLAALLVLLPLPSRWRSRSVAALAIISWLFIADLVQAINSIVWLDNTRNTVPVWCDIATRIMVGASFALPIAMLCICRHLKEASSSSKISFNSKDRRRRMIFEGGMCFGLPLVFVALHYIVEGHRFDMFEATGCHSAVYESIPSVLIIWIPQLLFSLIALVYAALALRNSIHRRPIFSLHLENFNSGLTTNQYVRLLAMAIASITWSIALVVINFPDDLQAWTTWDDVHFNWSYVGEWSEASTSQGLRDTTMLLWWAMPVSSFIFFLAFGLGVDAKEGYLGTWAWLKRVILRQRPSDEGATEHRSSPRSTKLKPLRLLTDRFNPKTKQISQISSPVLVATSNRSLYPLIFPSPIDSESRSSQSDTAEISTMIFPPSEMSSVDELSTFSCPYNSYIQSADSSRFVENFSSDSPESYFAESPQQHVDLPSPAYHRPFSGPSICPVPQRGPARPSQGIMLTIHRQASVDHIV